MPPPLLLIVNSGSSSIKFALYTCDAEPGRVASGSVSAIGGPGATLSVDRNGESISIADAGATHEAAVARIVSTIQPYLVDHELAGIVHRVVHGGERFDRAQPLTPPVLEELRELVPLAPNHLPDQLRLVDVLALLKPGTPQIGCFDTAFHHGLPEVSRTLPVPGHPGLRRYGFHGLSYTFLLSALENTAGRDAARGRVIFAHLGNGASLAAVLEGRCVDTSMGLTPTGGLVMSTRAGDLDPAVVIYLARLHHLSNDQIEAMLTRASGLLAISGRTADVQELLACEETDPRCRLAIDIFCYQIRKWIGAFSAVLAGLDTLVFSGGIGEHAAAIRARVCEPLLFLGVKLDPVHNLMNAPVISTADSRVVVRVIPTDEALMMAREAHAVLTGVS